MNVSIVGAGIHGLSTAVALARRGCAVTLFDQGSIPNPVSSSVDDHRLIRHAYGARHGYAVLVVHAYEAWQRLWEHIGVSHYVETGTLAVGHAGSGWIRSSTESLRALGLPVHAVSADEARAYYPTLRMDVDDEALYAPGGGVLMAGRIMDALATEARRLGVALHEHVRCTQESLPASDHVLWCTGAWTPAPLVTPSRQVLGYLSSSPSWARDGASDRPLPMMIDLDERGGLYIVPGVAGTRWKYGMHRFSLHGSPDEDRAASPEERQELLAVYRSRMHDDPVPALETARACYYAVNDRARITLTSGPEGLRLSGGSGHSFKFGALVGNVLAAVITGEMDAAAADRLLGGELSADTSADLLRGLPH